MFQKTDPTAAPFSIQSLLILLAISLSGCSGLQMGTSSEHSRAVTGGYRSNETLAVLLPESGRFAGAARVVRDGIVAAREADPQGRRPKLLFYSSASGSVTALVQKASADGASLVIGPLQKRAVDELARSSALPIPVLALNQASAGGRPPQNLYQFALSPEGEAADVADKAWSDGHRRALMLYPEGNWGSRISRGFLQAWKGHGGTMAGTQVYDPAATDFSDTVARLSERAPGADFLFLVAPSKLARQIWPLIRQDPGIDLPVYSTSHIYGGRFNPESDRNLVGLNFVEIPWLVEPSRGDAVSSRGLHKSLPRLYAMGVDAYRLGSRLNWMANSRQARVYGKTGILTMDSQRRIHRELTLARINASGPVKVGALDSLNARTFVWSVPASRLGPRLAAAGSLGADAIPH